MPWDQIVAVGGVVGAIVIIGGAGITVVKGMRWLWRLGRRTGHFLDDWNGEEARDGRPATPGALARLTNVEKELRPNGGSTLKDAITRLEKGLSTVSDQLSTNTGTLEGINGTVSTLDARVSALEAGKSGWRSGRMGRKS